MHRKRRQCTRPRSSGLRRQSFLTRMKRSCSRSWRGRWVAGRVCVRRRSRLPCACGDRTWRIQWPCAGGRSSVAEGHSGHGIVMPQCHHGGPGRAGNGEELAASTACGFITSVSRCKARPLSSPPYRRTRFRSPRAICGSRGSVVQKQSRMPRPGLKAFFGCEFVAGHR